MSQELFAGSSIRVRRIADGIAELSFDRQGESINKLDQETVAQLAAAVQAIARAPDLRGLLVSSAKDSFIVGADIFEFQALFAKGADGIAAFNAGQAAVFAALADLPLPSVALVEGMALGGGFETALACDYRVLSDHAQLGLPEVSLGIIPGFGGCVRLPRLLGAGAALEWITSGKPRKAAEALKAGAADAVCAPPDARNRALQVLEDAIAGDAWKPLRRLRQGPVLGFDVEPLQALKKAAQANAHYPAALAAVQLVERSAALPYQQALAEESTAFGRIAATPTADALVQIFVNEQALKRKAKAYAAAARKTRRAAVLGAGIMGGGIAYTSAARGIPVLMKDIAQPALDLGKREAAKLLAKQVAGGRLAQDKAKIIDESIVPTLDYQGFGEVDTVVEAIVENIDVKRKVLAELETHVGPDTVIASNTSSLSIAAMAQSLQRPQNFVGMHFFNPVPVMPLVEVIRGPQTSELAAASIAAYGAAMGKTPVVVQDCPGFLVNRILNAYFVGFCKLIRDGADFEQVDRAMEAFGWPMGPAYLQDVVGMDTSSHVFDVIAQGYPERMLLDFINPIRLMAQHKRYGQKNGAGFYRYETVSGGRPAKQRDEEAHRLLAQIQPGGIHNYAAQDIVDRLMLPMVVEAAICIEQAVVGSAAELDMSLILGLGFPRHLGGILKYADLIGAAVVVERCAALEPVGAEYHVPRILRDMAVNGRRFHGLLAAPTTGHRIDRASRTTYERQ